MVMKRQGQIQCQFQPLVPWFLFGNKNICPMLCAIHFVCGFLFVYLFVDIQYIDLKCIWGSIDIVFPHGRNILTFSVQYFRSGLCSRSYRINLLVFLSPDVCMKVKVCIPSTHRWWFLFPLGVWLITRPWTFDWQRDLCIQTTCSSRWGTGGTAGLSPCRVQEQDESRSPTLPQSPASDQSITHHALTDWLSDWVSELHAPVLMLVSVIKRWSCIRWPILLTQPC